MTSKLRMPFVLRICSFSFCRALMQMNFNLVARKTLAKHLSSNLPSVSANGVEL